MAITASIVIQGIKSAQTATTGSAKIHNVVLVHGAFTDGSCWSDVIARLQARHYNVVAVQNPLTSLSDDVTATKRTIARMDGPVILVGHSYAGAVITEAGIDDNVAGLVYISALAPDSGESITDLQRHGPLSEGVEGAKSDSIGYLWFDPASYGSMLADDVPAERVRLLAATQQPISAACFDEKLSVAAWRKTPSWYLISENDRALAHELQRWMARRMNASTLAVPSSHMSLISQANSVVTLIKEASHA